MLFYLQTRSANGTEIYNLNNYVNEDANNK